MTKFFAFLFLFATAFSSSRTVFALELMPVGVQQVADVASAAHMAARKADALLIPTDNLLASSVSVVAKIAITHKKPLIVSDVLLIEQGAFAGQGIDYFQSGAKAALVASKVLFGGAQPSELELSAPVPTKVIINQKTKNALGLGDIQ